MPVGDWDLAITRHPEVSLINSMAQLEIGSGGPWLSPKIFCRLMPCSSKLGTGKAALLNHQGNPPFQKTK